MADDITQNVLGTPLETCCTDPLTGFFRDGSCRTDLRDVGTHVICARMTERFLSYTYEMGNDLSTPCPANQFPGLKPGDKWCLCAMRWKQAMDAGTAPPVILKIDTRKSARLHPY